MANSANRILLLSLAAILVLWVMQFYHSRSVLDQHMAELLAFKNTGERFTADDGAILRARIEALERRPCND